MSFECPFAEAAVFPRVQRLRGLPKIVHPAHAPLTASRDVAARGTQDPCHGEPSRQGGRVVLDASPILHWLARECAGLAFVEDILLGLCVRLVEGGVAISHASTVFAIDHPQWLATRIIWKRGAGQASVTGFEHGSLGSIHYQDSFVQLIHDGADSVRSRLETAGPVHPFYDELRADGVTDFKAWMLPHTQGRRHVATFATDRPGGFRDEELALIEDIVPVFALLTEIRLKNHFARTLLETYVGPHASREILAGAVTRASGRTVNAAVLMCDLRGFTSMSERLPREELTDLLNGYFDAVCEPIDRHGGEILKFMGDGLLAIFPMSQDGAAMNLLRAVDDIGFSVEGLNERRGNDGKAKLRHGIGIHVGDVMFGNIGSRKRLDFTVIGPAVNVASRLEGLTGTVGRSVLVSKAFVDTLGTQTPFESLGTFPLHGMDEPIEVFALTAAFKEEGAPPMNGRTVA